jgi:YesN/AraC family two-component response regulator
MTDIVMPDMNGLEFAKELKQYPDLLVVILSSFSDYDYMREALRLNITDYILKPVNYESLTDYFQKAKEILDQRNSISDTQGSSYYEKLIRQVDEYLKANYRNAKLGEAAERVAISASYLSKIYKEKCSIGFYDKLLRIRMEKAAEMLRDPAFKGYEIAALVGYDNPKNFSRAFKVYYQVTPREYRNGMKG